MDGAGTGFAAMIAAAALLGTLLALGCLFLGIFLYARQLRGHAKSALKGPPATTTLTRPSILKKSLPEAAILEKESAQKGYPRDGRVDLRGFGLPARAALPEFNELTEMAYLQGQQRFIEPDLINAVPAEAGYLAPRPQPDFEAYSNCLDRDGYPLNFGLPKLESSALRTETLPRACHRAPHPQPSARFAHEVEFLSRTGYGYPVHPLLNLGYMPAAPPAFLPSPPAAYRTEPAALSPRSLLQAKSPMQEAAADHSLRLVPPPPLPPPSSPLVEPLESREALQHPESPDEGYVGDAMDV